MPAAAEWQFPELSLYFALISIKYLMALHYETRLGTDTNARGPGSIHGMQLVTLNAVPIA